MDTKTPDEFYFATLPANQTGSMSVKYGLSTASVVPLRHQAPDARRRGQLCTGVPSQQGSTYRTLFGVQTSGATSAGGLRPPATAGDVQR